jgi:hypothetical protein
VDAEGYSISVSNGTFTLSIDNRCYYPNPSIDNVAGLYCKTAPALTPQGSAQLGDGSGPAVKESAGFSLLLLPNSAPAGSGPEGAFTLDFGSLAPGSYRLIYSFDAADNSPDAAHPGCVQEVETEFTLQQVDCGDFPWDGD